MDTIICPFFSKDTSPEISGGDYSGHRGIDFTGSWHDTILAPCKSKIIRSQWRIGDDDSGPYGYVIDAEVLEGPYIGCMYRIAHMYELLVVADTIVEMCTPLGIQGGSSDEQDKLSHHVHFELFPDTTQIWRPLSSKEDMANFCGIPASIPHVRYKNAYEPGTIIPNPPTNPGGGGGGTGTGGSGGGEGGGGGQTIGNTVDPLEMKAAERLNRQAHDALDAAKALLGQTQAAKAAAEGTRNNARDALEDAENRRENAQTAKANAMAEHTANLGLQRAAEDRVRACEPKLDNLAAQTQTGLAGLDGATASAFGGAGASILANFQRFNGWLAGALGALSRRVKKMVSPATGLRRGRRGGAVELV